MTILPHYERLHAYTFSLVLSALEKLGPPAALAKVGAQSQRGPLLVTLATELACVCVGLLHESLTRGLGWTTVEDCLQIYGGDGYRTAFRNYQRAFQAKEAAVAEITRLENRTLRHGAARLNAVAAKREPSTKCANGGRLYWQKSPPCGLTTAQAWLREHRYLSGRLQKLSKEARSLGRSLQRRRQRISRSSGFQDFAQKSLQDRELIQPPSSHAIRCDFDGDHPLLAEGAASALRTTDPHWWRAFARLFNQQMQKTTERGHIRLLLRDAHLAEAAQQQAVSDNSNIDDAWTKILRCPRENWISLPYTGKSGALNDDDLRAWRKELRREDTIAKEWFRCNGGVGHPCVWAMTSGISLLVSRDYPAARAKNELNYCLSGSVGSFVPLFSRTLTKKKWEAWLKQASVGKPAYWKRKAK